METSVGQPEVLSWLAQGDDFGTFLSELVSSMPQVDLFGVESVAD
jgi:hypothetical protein